MTINKITDLKSVQAYLDRVGAEPKGLFSAIVKEMVGEYWNETAHIRFDRKTGDVVASVGYEPTEDELSLIKAEFASVKWPQNVYPAGLENLPEHLKNADEESLFIFWDKSHKHILMLQHRIETDKGKAYIPWSYFDDGVWRPCEPETENGLRPLYGLHTLKDQTVAFVSEGAKTSRFVERLINPKTPEEKKLADEFPWKEQFKYAASVGFVGGAMASRYTDWSALKKAGIQRVIILADNDFYGVDAIPVISDLINLPCFAIKFSEDFPAGFDVADPFPPHLYKEIKGRRYYVGASYFDCLHAATYMTYLKSTIDEKGKEKKVPVLRHHAKQQWCYIEGQDTFINTEFPQFSWSPERLDKVLAPFSHSKKTSDLLLQEYSTRMSKIAYRPDVPKRKVMSDGELALNLYRPSNFTARAGDPQPFLDFMKFLIPDEKECYELLKWCATLIARPDIRMLYGVLLISENTGIGKTLVAETILAPLVGMHNVSFPTEEIIMQPYTTWLAKRRLAVIGEIYQGHSFKMANKLKQFITDNKISYREMYENPVTMDNFCHFFACSNSINALRFDEKERRWYVPKVSEQRLKDSQYDDLILWLQSGGLSIIKQWATDWTDYVRRGDKAPSTERKQEMIESSRSKASVRAEELSGLMNDYAQPVAVADKSVKAWMEAITKERVYESELELRKIMSKAGVHEFKNLVDGKLKNERMSYESQMSNVLLSQKALDALDKISDIGARKEFVRSILKRPNELLNYED